MDSRKRKRLATAEQRAANKRNALKSTGPRTAKGKAISKMNAVKHGLLAHTVIIHGEDEDEFEELRRQFFDEYSPVGPLERELLETVTVLFWRQRRTHLVEAGIFERAHAREIEKASARDIQKVTAECLEQARISMRSNSSGLGIEPQEPERTDKPGENRREAKMPKMAAALGQAFITDSSHGNAFNKLSRYQTTMARLLFGTLRELERIQANRRREEERASQ